MTPFFRRIRHKLANDNQFLKYSRYAIGEILLVVVGILIALQINTWNNKRIEDKRVVSFLQDFKIELITDTLGLNSNIKNYKALTSAKQNLLVLKDYKDIPTDSLAEIITPQNGAFSPSTTTFQKITNLGMTKISNNDSLSKMIYSYYTKTLSSFQIFYDWDVESTALDGDYWINNQNVFEINMDSDIPIFQNDKTNRLGLINIISEPKGRNRINMDLYRKKRILVVLERTKRRASELIFQIEKELN